MKRTTVMLPQDLKMRAIKCANMMGISLGEFMRESLETALSGTTEGPLADDSLFADSVVFHGKAPSNLAKRHDDYLYEDKA